MIVTDVFLSTSTVWMYLYLKSLGGGISRSSHSHRLIFRPLLPVTLMLLLLTMLSPPASEARFKPEANVYVADKVPASTYAGQYPAKADTAPALSALTYFESGDEILEMFQMTMPLHWRVNGEAIPASCAEDKLFEYCPPSSRVGSVVAYIDDYADCRNCIYGDVYLVEKPVTDPVEIALVFPTLEGIAPPIIAKMYMRDGDLRINTDLDTINVNYLLLGFIRKLEMHLNYGTDQSLLRTEPVGNGCSREHVFDWYMKSREGSIVSGQSPVPLVECNQVSKRFKPRVSVETSTTAAGQSPNVKVTIKRDKGDAYLKSMKIHLPDGMMGSPNATSTLCSTDQARQNACPSSSKVADSSMEAKVFESRDPIAVEGSVYNAPTTSCADSSVLACLLFVGKTPPIASSQIIVMPVQLTARAGVSGIDAALGTDGEAPIPPEFDLRKIEFTFNGTTGKDLGHPLLINPTDCNDKKISVDFTSELDQAYTVDVGYPVTDCDALSYSPNLSVDLSCLEPQCIPNINIRLTAPPFGVATTKDVNLAIPKTFQINSRSKVIDCTAAQAQAQACPPESQIGEAVMESPLVVGPMYGKLYLGAPTDASTVKRVITQVTGLISMTIEGKLVANPGGGFSTVINDLPEVPISNLTLSLYGGIDRGLLITPYACGTHTFNATSQSHSGKLMTINYPVKVQGKKCGPRMSARLKPNKAKRHTNLKVIVRPREGAPIKQLQVRLGSKKRRIKVKSKSRRKKVGTITLTPRTGRKLKAKIYFSKKRKSKRKKKKRAKSSAKKRSKKRSKKRKTKLTVRGGGSSLKKVKITLKKGKLTVKGLPNKELREIVISIDGQKSRIIRNPKRCGRLTLKGSFKDFEGSTYSAKAKPKVKCLKKKRKRRNKRKRK